MDEELITALAREYAEEATKDIPLDNDIKSLRESAIKLNAEGMEKRLRWLLRRFCLVEKSKVKQLKQCFGSEEVYDVIDMLFPEIAKEVEP